jgi:hypothetical protein
MGFGSSCIRALEELAGEGGRGKDNREFLAGFCTVFQDGSPLAKKYGLTMGTETAKGQKVKTKYDYEVTDPSDWDNFIIVTTGRMYWAQEWGPHVDPLHHGKLLSTQTTKNTWFKEPGFKGPPGIENAQGLQNPQEGIVEWMKKYNQTKDWSQVPENWEGDAGLCATASQCVQAYYPPNLQIKNPHYGKNVAMSLSDALVLFEGMYVYGDTGGDSYGYYECAAPCRQLAAQACTSFPYGTYYFGAAVGSCSYATTAALGWNSAQLCLMSTGGGNSKFCTYPGYDFETIYIANRGVMCKGENPYSFKMLDVTGGGDLSMLDFYTKYGFVQGSNVNGDSNAVEDTQKRLQADEKRYKAQPFNACAMPLNEQNVDPKLWGKHTANELFMTKPSGKCEWDNPDYEQCIAGGGTPSGWAYAGADGSVVTCRDCPYQDKPGSVRTHAKQMQCQAKFSPQWIKDLGKCGHSRSPSGPSHGHRSPSGPSHRHRSPSGPSHRHRSPSGPNRHWRSRN